MAFYVGDLICALGASNCMNLIAKVIIEGLCIKEIEILYCCCMLHLFPYYFVRLKGLVLVEERS